MNLFIQIRPFYELRETIQGGPKLLVSSVTVCKLFVLFPGALWPGVVAADRVLSMGQIELNCVLMLNWIVGKKTIFDI